MTTADSHEFWGAIFVCGFIWLILGGVALMSLHIQRQAKRAAKARRDEMERRREKSRVYWAWRSAPRRAAQARKSGDHGCAFARSRP